LYPFAIERYGDWPWGIAQVPDEICKFFSARRTAIETELAAAGLSSTEAPALAAAITHKTRKRKETDPNIDRFARWLGPSNSSDMNPRRVSRMRCKPARRRWQKEIPRSLIC
jgi:hypothetical protein